MADTQHLSLRGRTWWYIRKIPPALSSLMRQPHTGKAHYRFNLKTSDLAIAQRRRPTLNAAVATEFEVAKKRLVGDPDIELKAKADDLWSWVQRGGHADDIAMRESVGQDLALESAEEIERTHNEDTASRFYLRATGQKRGSEIDEHVEKWIAENKASPHTNFKRRKVVGNLTKWRANLFVESITREIAGAFVDEVIAPGRKVATINGDLGVLASYWKWMMRQGLIPEASIHWSKFRRKSERKPPDEKQRAFTNQEMQRLFFSPIKMRPDLLDMATASALTGGRLEEIGKLRVKFLNFEAMTIYLPGFKTDAAPRIIPLHPDLRKMFERRCLDKSVDAWIFHELPIRKPDSTKGRSSPVSMAFTRYRRALEVDHVLDNETRSLINFHSFRRWFSTKLLELNTPHDVVDTIMGWARVGMRGRYSVNADFMDQMRSAVSRVVFPTKP